MPAGARPGRGNARAARPRPYSPPWPPAPPRLWRAEPRAPLAAAAADVAPTAPRSQQCRAGKTKGIRFASFPVSQLHSREPHGVPGRQGPRPQGPRATRAPTCPRRPRPLLPPPPPARPPASQAQGLPHPGTLGLLVPRDPVVLSPRRAARSSKIASGPRAPTHPAPGASRGRLGNRLQTPPPLPSGRRCAPGFSFLFFSSPDGKEGDRLLRIHQLSSQQKSWRKGRLAGAIGGEGRRAMTPSLASTPGRSV